MITFNNVDNLKQYILDELKATDYAMLSDVKILNKRDFIIYRSFLRQALQDLFLSTQFNERPQPVWGSLEVPKVNALADGENVTTL
jgi:hypothetical protein